MVLYNVCVSVAKTDDIFFLFYEYNNFLYADNGHS